MSMHLYDRPVFSKLIFFEKGISAMSNLQVNMTKDPIVNFCAPYFVFQHFSAAIQYDRYYDCR